MLCKKSLIKGSNLNISLGTKLRSNGSCGVMLVIPLLAALLVLLVLVLSSCQTRKAGKLAGKKWTSRGHISTLQY